MINGFDESAIALVANYLSNRYQRVKIGSIFNSYLEILRGVSQGSILGSILFKLLAWWLLTLKKQKSATLPMILKRQPWNYVMAHIWFLIGLELIVWWQTLANFRLCFLSQTLIIAKITSIIENKIVKSRSEIKLVGITIGDKLSFTKYIGNLCSTTSNRLQDLARGY